MFDPAASNNEIRAVRTTLRKRRTQGIGHLYEQGKLTSESRPLWLAIARELRHDSFFIIAVTFVCTVVAVVISLVWPKTYTAQAAFVTENPADLATTSRLGELAASAGLLGTQSGEQSPQFYASLLEGREVLENLLQQPVHPANNMNDSTQLLLDYLKLKHEGRRRLDDGVELMRHRIATSVSDRIGTVRIWVDDRSPNVAAEITQALLDELNRFNVARRRSKATIEDEFIQSQLDKARAQLDSARVALTNFYQENRLVQAPGLRSREQQLNQEVAIRQTQVVDLEQAAFQAGLEGVRTTPSITVIERPVPPSRKSKPKRTLIVVLTFLLSGFLTTAYRALRGDIAGVWGRINDPAT